MIIYSQKLPVFYIIQVKFPILRVLQAKVVCYYIQNFVCRSTCGI